MNNDEIRKIVDAEDNKTSQGMSKKVIVKIYRGERR